MSYAHTQRGYFHWLMWAIAAVSLGVAVFTTMEGQMWVRWVVGAVGGVTLLFGFCFMRLRITGKADHLDVRFGPIPLFKMRLSYTDITSASVGTTSLVDGWGVHWVPGRGWTWNLWGYSCATLRVRGKPMRIGSDDAEALVAFLQSRIAEGGGGSSS